MSFAPRSRSRERNSFQSGVSAQPKVPVQKEPLHRYGAGVVVPGVSMKGSHQFEGVVVDGRAVTTKLNIHEKPTNLLRSTSPVTLRRPEILKTTRSNRSKSPLPLTSNTVSLSRSRANSPAGSATVVPNRTFLEISAKNINNLKRQTSDDSSVGSFSISSHNRPNSASSVSSKSYTSSNARSQLRKSDSFSIIENINHLNTFEAKSLARRSTSPSLHRSLAQSKMSAASPGVHNILLTQAAYRTVRQTANKDEMVDFMMAHRENSTNEDLGEIFEALGEEGRHYIQTLYNSTPPGVKTISEYRTSSPLTTTALTTSPSNAAEIRRIKKLLHLVKMCRDEIDREMAYYTSRDASNLYFQMENDKSQMVRSVRAELFNLVQNNYIPLLNGNLSKVREAETVVLNDNKTQMNELHSVINDKEDELAKLTETNNKLKSKVSKFLRKYDPLTSDTFQQVMVESYGRPFTNTILDQLHNPQLWVAHSPESSPVHFQDDLNEDGPDQEAFEVFGLDEHPHGDEYDAAGNVESPAAPSPPVKDRFLVNYDVIQQLANISPKITPQRVVPDVTPPRKYPASPFMQQHSPNAMVQSVLQGYKSPNATRFLRNVSQPTSGSHASAPGSASRIAGASTLRDDLSEVFRMLDGSHPPSQIQSSDMMPHSAGSNVIPSHHVRSQLLYRRSMSPTTIHGQHSVTGVGGGSTAVGSVGVSPSTVPYKPPSPSPNMRQEMVTTPDHQSVRVTKIDYRQLHGVESFSSYQKQQHSPKMILRSPPKVPIPSFSTSSKSPAGSNSRSMMEVMLGNTY